MGKELGMTAMGYCARQRGRECLLGPSSYKASCALGSLDFILQARGFGGGGDGNMGRKGRRDYLRMN